MLLFLAVVLAGVIVWLAVLGLLGWRYSADARAARAAADHATVLAGTSLALHAREEPPERLEALVRQAAETNGLEPAMTAAEADGALTVSFEAAASTAALTWVGQLEAQGVRVAGFTALKNPDGTLQVRVTLAPAA